jgi:hypothetical protein
LLIEIISLLESTGVLSSPLGTVFEATPQAIILRAVGLARDVSLNELPRGRASGYQAEESLFFSFMKTLGFQTFLYTPRQSLEELID